MPVSLLFSVFTVMEDGEMFWGFFSFLHRTLVYLWCYCIVALRTRSAAEISIVR